jgi:hypothetical protein
MFLDPTSWSKTTAEILGGGCAVLMIVSVGYAAWTWSKLGTPVDKEEPSRKDKIVVGAFSKLAR